MGWANCGEDESGRPIGYAVSATCDEPGCDAEIDRGLSFVCGSMHGGGEFGCGRYFCEKHLICCHRVEDSDDIYHHEEFCGECSRAYDESHPDQD